jgi:hypothetical protein
MNSRLLPNRMPFGSWPVLVTRVEEAKHGCDLLYLGGEWGRFTSEAQKGHTLRNASREISYSSPYSTFSHTSTLPSAVAVILLPSKASGCVPKGHCQINLSTFLLPLRRLQHSPLPNGPFEAVKPCTCSAKVRSRKLRRECPRSEPIHQPTARGGGITSVHQPRLTLLSVLATQPAGQ